MPTTKSYLFPKQSLYWSWNIQLTLIISAESSYKQVTEAVICTKPYSYQDVLQAKTKQSNSWHLNTQFKQ
jgi:hypothetical protein